MESIYITPETLEDLDACRSQIKLFRAWLDSKGWSRVRPTPKNLRDAERYGLNITWAIQSDLVSRDVACEDARWAYRYAVNVDGEPRDDTRRAACESAKYAYEYASDVDGEPRDDTRRAACEDAKYAYHYAYHVDKGTRDDTRQAVCESAQWAYFYARNVDKGAYKYAKYVECKN